MSDITLASLAVALEKGSDNSLLWVFLALGAVLVAVLIRLWDRLAGVEREVKRLRYEVAQAALREASAPAAGSRPTTVPTEAAGAPHASPSSPPPASPKAGVPGPWNSDPASDARPAHGSRATTAPFADPGDATARDPSGTPIDRVPGDRELGGLFDGGNWLVRGGIVLLFIGVGFLLKFAADNALLPVPLRLAGVAAGGIALVVLGLRLVTRRRAYALALQGGGVGLLYLTLFAAFRLYGLLPVGAAFALMSGVVVVAGWLAWRQDALALAVLGALGGFAAPVLASTGSGSHVALFSYYAVLNAGILGLALTKSWRPLNLVGFVATFVLSALWGHRYYEPAHFITVEPFLVLFFAMYLGVAIAFARHRSLALADPMDSTLVFGTPLAVFGLQSRLLAGTDHGLAITAAAMAVLYGALWYAMRRRSDRNLDVLGEAFAALALGFVTVALALALDARWTSASWALEGAALVWVGWRQRRLLARLAGTALQFLAAAAWVAHTLEQARWESGDWFGAVTLALAGLVSSAVLAQPPKDAPASDERPFGIILGVWGLLFWYAGTGVQLSEWLSTQSLPGALLLAAASTALVMDRLDSVLRWPLAGVVARVLPLMLIPLALHSAMVLDHPLQSSAAPGWPLAMGAALWILRRQGAGGARGLAVGHAVWVWLAGALFALEMVWWFARLLPDVRSWQHLAWLLAPASVVAVVVLLAARARPWPFPAWSRVYLGVGAGPLVCVIGGGVFALSVGDPHGPWPIAYLPLLNPLDLGLALATGACVLWVSRARAILGEGLRNVALVSGAALGFLWLNGALLRTLHFWGDIPYRFSSFFNSTLAQASVSVLWASTGLIAMVTASRVSSRGLWGLGAGLMGVVAVKLMLVDLANSATIARIVSFISVGLLMMLVGYLAPVPPARAPAAADAQDENRDAP